MSEEIEYWYNTKTLRVEEGPKSLALYRIGPFATRQEAENGLNKVLERAKALREEDERSWD